MNRYNIRFRFCYINENGLTSIETYDNTVPVSADTKEQAVQTVKNCYERNGDVKVIQIVKIQKV